MADDMNEPELPQPGPDQQDDDPIMPTLQAGTPEAMAAARELHSIRHILQSMSGHSGVDLPDSPDLTVPLKTGASGKTANVIAQNLAVDARYEIGRLIARGGMGAVLAARDVNCRRSVAMKVMLGSKRAEPNLVIRFIEEAQVTAQLEHPGIVPVHELGLDQEENVYYTMKYVRGTSLQDILMAIRAGDDAMIRSYPLSTLLSIYMKVCDAVGFAHSKGVIHRDLKPDNIMVGDYGEVLVVDWGLAKILGRPDPEALHSAPLHVTAVPADSTIAKRPEWLQDDVDSLRQSATGAGYETLEGEAMGTPQFMAPEQARGQLDRLDARTDIYALGGILYAILTLRPPIDGRANVHSLLVRVVEGDIPAPTSYNRESRLATRQRRSTQTRANADTRHQTTDTPAEPAKPTKPGDLDLVELAHLPGGTVPPPLAAVAMHALATEQDDRYHSVNALQRDVTAYLEGYATEAEEAGLHRLLILMLRRHRKLVSVAAIALAALLVVAVVAFVNITNESAKAQAAREEADAARAMAEQKLQQANNQLGLALLERAKRYDADGRTLSGLLTGERTYGYAHIGHPDLATTGTPLLADPALRPEHLERVARRANNLGRYEAVFSLGPPPPDSVSAYTIDSTGSRLAYKTGFGPIKIWDLNQLKLAASLTEQPGVAQAIAFSHDGRRLYSAGLTNPAKADGSPRPDTSPAGDIYIWNLASTTISATLSGHDGPVTALAVSPDDRLLASTQIRDGQPHTRVWDLASGETLHSFSGEAEMFLRFAAQGDTLYRLHDGQVQLVDARSLAIRQRFPHTTVAGMISPNGQLLARGTAVGEAELWDLQMGKLVTVDHSTEDTILGPFSPASDYIFSAGERGAVSRWTTRNYRRLEQLEGHIAQVVYLGITADGGRVVTVSELGVVRIWDMHTLRRVSRYQPPTSGPSLTHPGTGGRHIAWIIDGSLHVRRVADGTRFPPIPLDGADFRLLPRRDHVLLLTDDLIRQVDLETGETLQRLPRAPRTSADQAISLSDDGRLLLYRLPERDGQISLGLNQLQLQRPSARLPLQDGDTTPRIHFSPDTDKIAITEAESTVIYKRDDPTVTGITIPRQDALAFSPDAAWLAGATAAGLQVWDSATGNARYDTPVPTSAEPVRQLRVSPDGATIIAAYADGVRFVDLETGRLISHTHIHPRGPDSIQFSADGLYMISADAESIRIWELSTRLPLATIVPPDGVRSFSASAYHPDGYLLTASPNSATIDRWDIHHLHDALPPGLMRHQTDNLDVTLLPPLEIPGLGVIPYHRLHGYRLPAQPIIDTLPETARAALDALITTDTAWRTANHHPALTWPDQD